MHKSRSKKNRVSLQVSVSVLLFLSIISAIYYFTFLFNPKHIDNIYLYVCLIFIEVYIAIQTVGAWWTMLYADHDPRNHHYHEEENKLLLAGKVEGGVDVFITVYGEPLEVIFETVKAARDMLVEHNTHILDDGKSDEVKKLAEELGVNYIRRDTNEGKKAGNVNNALSNTKAKYVVVFDADHKPRPDYLLETLPFFSEEEVAFVQTPQVMNNRTNIISIGSGDSQKIFYELVGKGKNKFNAMFWVGTNAIFRREAIESVGGVVIHASEDIFTAYKLHQQGWHSVYIPETLAIGQAPEDIDVYFKQQVRWARGGLTIFFFDNPLFKKGLNLDQKIQYFLTSTFYFNGLVILLMILLPVIYLCFGLKPLGNSDFTTWASHYIPYFLLQFIVLLVLTDRFSWQAFVLSINSFPAYLKALAIVITKKEITWKASGASGSNENKLGYLRTHIILIVVIVFSILVSLVNVYDYYITLLSIFWCVINVITLGIFVRENLKNPETKKQEVNEFQLNPQ